jgi:hypothetical protein
VAASSSAIWKPELLRAVDLRHRLVDIVGERRYERRLERPGRDDDLAGRDRLVVRRDDVSAITLGQRRDPRVEPHGQVEGRRVGTQVRGDIVLRWVGVLR